VTPGQIPRGGVRRARPARLALAAAALLLPALAACEPEQLGAAAIVDDTRITVSEIQGALEIVRDAQERLGVPTEDLADAALREIQRRVVVLIYTEAAEREGLTITEGEVATRRAAYRQAAGSDSEYERRALQNPSFPRTLSGAEDDIRLELIERKLADKLSAAAGRTLTNDELGPLIEERLVATAKSMRVRINPRYGQFDPEGGAIKPYPFDFFRPSPEPEASAGG
jgi:hypothetical protein